MKNNIITLQNGKIITLKNGKEYLIINNCTLNNEIYYFTCEVENEEATDNFKVLQIKENNQKKVIHVVEDDTIIKQVCTILDRSYN